MADEGRGPRWSAGLRPPEGAEGRGGPGRGRRAGLSSRLAHGQPRDAAGEPRGLLRFERQSPTPWQIEAKFEEELRPIAFNRLKPKEYLDPKGSTESERRAKEARVKDLRHMLQEFARAGFVDTVDFIGLRGFTRRPSNDYGVVILCSNHWSPDHVAILAAGIGGPGTAAALELLARPGAFAERPLGGVFEVAISQEAAWEDRFDLLDIEWNSHPYGLDQYRNDGRRLVELSSEGRIYDPAAQLQDADTIIINELIDLLQRRGV